MASSLDQARFARTSMTRAFTAGAISLMNIRNRGAVGTPHSTKVEKP